MAKTKQKSAEASAFVSAIDCCTDIKGQTKTGMSALGVHSAMVKVKNTRLLDGSVDIDAAVKKIYPHDSRWDYVVGYNGRAYFIEVHPAETRNINEMIAKVKWLRHWLMEKASELKGLHHIDVYYWLPSGRVKILKHSNQYHKIAANNLKLVSPPLIIE